MQGRSNAAGQVQTLGANPRACACLRDRTLLGLAFHVLPALTPCLMAGMKDVQTTTVVSENTS